MKTSKVQGRVVDPVTQRGQKGLRVEVWDKDFIVSDLVGGATTSEDGNFRIQLDEPYVKELFIDRVPNLYFKVYLRGKLIKSTENSVLWNVETGDTEITIEIPSLSEKGSVLLIDENDASVSLSISGFLFNAANGYPLAGLKVEAYFPELSIHESVNVLKGKRQQERLLGEGISGSNGRFNIILRVNRQVRQEICFLKHYEDTSFNLRVLSRTGLPYFVSEPLSVATLFPVTFFVSLPEKPVSETIWKEFGTRLEEARIVQLHEIVRFLVYVSLSQALFIDWDLEKRHAVLTELEKAFLDPHKILQIYSAIPTLYSLRKPQAFEMYRAQIQPHLKSPSVQKAFWELSRKVQSFCSLGEIDWIIDPSAFKQGKPGEAVSKFQNLYDSDLKVDWDSDFPELLLPSDLSRYRDYLRNIFTGAPGSEGYMQFKKLLERRFHQNFETMSIAQKPANRILIHILNEILTAPIGSDYGFGIKSDSIQTQGQMNDREYLEYLVGLTNLSSNELGLRYRLNLDRYNDTLSSEVHENIATLQGFYRDSFQCDREPFPIIPLKLQGRAPFFLYYDEWLQTKKPFYAENYYNIKKPFLLDLTEQDRIRAENLQDSSDGMKFFVILFNLQDTILNAHKAFNQGEYGIARAIYHEAALLAETALDMGLPKRSWGGTGHIPADQVDDLIREHENLLSYLKNAQITNMEELQDWESCFDAIVEHSTPFYYNIFDNWREENRLILHFFLIYVSVYQIPLCLGDVALSIGNYEEAVKIFTNFVKIPFGMSVEKYLKGYAKTSEHYYNSDRQSYMGGPGLGIHNSEDSRLAMFLEGYLPYSLSMSPLDVDKYDSTLYLYPRLKEVGYSYARLFASKIISIYTNSMQDKYFRLRQCSAILEWADTLYRSDDPSKIGRARELYKAVLFLHGEIPPIAPSWTDSVNPDLTVWSDIKPNFIYHAENPSITSQKNRARKAYFQIQVGLNYYGYSKLVVPHLRYQTFKDAADRFAASAKSAQQDFLLYMGNIERIMEEALRESSATENALRKSYLFGQIAREQAKNASLTVEQAEQQVVSIMAAIDAKRREIEDKDSFISQIGDFAEGFSDALGKFIPSKATEAAELDKVKSVAGVTALSGGSVMVGYGLFLYGSYSSMSSMEDAANMLQADLRSLQRVALPAAQKLVNIRKGELTIANLQYQIAQADSEYILALAAALRAFQQNRFLSLELWSNLAAVIKRIMRRYLDLSARYAWLAERALSYEQDRDVRIVRFDYFPVQLQGVTGADLLQLDLGRDCSIKTRQH